RGGVHLLSLYFHFVKVHIKSEMEYRISFLMSIASHFCITFLDFLAIALIFSRFHTLQHWSLWEVAFFYGMIGVSFSLAEMIGRGFDVFPSLVVRGEFDNMLIRPLGTFYQVFAYQFQLRRLGRMSQGLMVLLVAVKQLGIQWTLGKLAFLLASLGGGICFFIGLHVVGATICFWTVQSIEIINVFTYGGTEAGSYPMSIYRYWFRSFFTFVVPLAFASYFPALTLIEKADPNGAPAMLSYISPAVGLLFLMLTTVFWRFGVKRYHSTGH
ncbi:MAG: ABC-2 family transporter protein, partial [Candidatus Poribacteria bacterium]|nr:ABC-2 family transporter protein [Candidatus Poribacteria bacterium]